MRHSPLLRCIALPAMGLLIIAMCGAGDSDSVDSPEAAAIRQAVVDAGTILGERDQPLLPVGTCVERVEWVGDVMHVELALPD